MHRVRVGGKMRDGWKGRFDGQGGEVATGFRREGEGENEGHIYIRA